VVGELDTSTFSLFQNVDCSHEKVKTVVAGFCVLRILLEYEPIFSSMVGVPCLACSPSAHSGGVNICDEINVVLPAVPFPLEKFVDGAVKGLGSRIVVIPL